MEEKKINQYNAYGYEHGYWDDFCGNKGHFINGLKDGYWEEHYDVGGGVTWKVFYVDGKEEGIARFFLKGKLSFIAFYKNGKRSGLCTNYSSMGEITSYEFYAD